jgi:uncharacterized protein DUF6161
LTELKREYSALQKGFDAWYEDTKDRANRQNYGIEEDSKQLLDEKEEKLEKLSSDYVVKMDERLQGWEQKIEAHIAAYDKKLSLAKPVEYWNKLAFWYRVSGCVFTGLTFILGVAMAVAVLWLIQNFESLKTLNTENFKPSSIKGSILMITLFTLSFYLLHIFAKFALSAFHLGRDYKEREQLTYVYLALLKEGAIKDDNDILQVVLQSLFSRADTGLLKGDHSPTLPGGLETIKKIISN